MYKEIGIVGQGFVGTAVKSGFENTVEVLDPNGDIQFTNANYLMPVKEWKSVIW